MRRNSSAYSSARRIRLVAAAVLVAGLFPLLLFSGTRAQEESPTFDLGPILGTEEPTPEPETDTILRIEVAEDAQPVAEGEEFEANVMVENVEHLAAFDFSIGYDPERLEPVFEEDAGTPPAEQVDVSGGTNVQVDEAGQFIRTSPRGETLQCPLHFNRDNQVTVSCNTFAQPVCVGGPEGASGSGLLATVPFRSKGGGDTVLELSDSTLILDDVDPCEPGEDFQVIQISHRREDATVRLAGGGLGTGTIIGIVAGVVIIAALAGSAGLFWYRRRQARSSP